MRGKVEREMVEFDEAVKKRRKESTNEGTD